MTDVVDGGLFSRTYLIPNEKLSDSDRARRRVLALLISKGSAFADEFASQVVAELGVKYPGLSGYYHRTFFEECELRDFLDSITIFIRLVRSNRMRDITDECARILKEENLRYRLDDKGGVHFLVDETFERNIAYALNGLGNSKFTSARHELELAMLELSSQAPSGKAVIQKIFHAVESCFLVLANDGACNRLNDANLERFFKPLLLTRYRDYPERADNVDRLLKVFAAWVRAAHPFRHGIPLDEVHEAPLDYAVILADQGMALIRLMVGEQSDL